MEWNKDLVRSLGERVLKGELTWKTAADLYNAEMHDNINRENFRGKYRRLKDAPSHEEVRMCENEVHNADGSIDISKDFYFDPNENKTPEDILKLFGYSPEEWELITWNIGKWSVAIKDEETNRECYTVRAKIKPKSKDKISDAEYLEIARELFSSGITPKKFIAEKKSDKLDSDKMILLPQIEAHLGKVSECIDTGVVYNKDIVIERVEKIFNDTVKLQRDNKCDKCLVVIGGDFFNSESNNATTNGTPQRNDIGYKSMFNIGLDLYTRGILLLREFFNEVEVIPCVGNHSRSMEFFLYMALSCYFKNDKKVTFSENYRDTQSFVFGNTSLFFNHGDPNEKRLIASIPAEFYKEYGATQFRYLFLGHLHKLDQINTENGLTVHRVPAICEDDSWHYMNRFGVGNNPAQEVIVFDKNHGMVSSNYIYFNDKDENLSRKK